MTALSDVHDGYLVGIVLKENKDIVLEITTVQKATISIILKKSKYFCCNNLREGNIVFDIEIEDRDAIDEKSIASYFGFSENIDAEKFKQIIGEIKSGRWKVVFLNPSFGADIVCVCEGVDFE